MRRIGIVNDRMVEHVCQIILSVPDYTIAWIARNGDEAVKKCTVERPDLIVLDPDIPGMDGIEATRRIMKETPCPILIVTPTVEGNAARVFEALGCGALDAVNTPSIGYNEQAQRSQKAFLKKIQNIIKLQEDVYTPLKPKTVRLVVPQNAPPLVVIGSSTGGPKTLVKVLARLPKNLGAALVIAQHLDQEFSAGLADWLNAQSPIRVQLAHEGEHPAINIAYVAGTNDHLVITSDLTFSYTPEPRNNPYRPSVDVLFLSVAEHWPGRGCAVLLTGMGRDGATGLASLRKLGWYTIAQDKETSVVYGMPKAAKELNAAVEILAIEDIGPAMLNSLKRITGKSYQ
jgi:two-component system response regulator WspF